MGWGNVHLFLPTVLAVAALASLILSHAAPRPEGRMPHAAGLRLRSDSAFPVEICPIFQTARDVLSSRLETPDSQSQHFGDFSQEDTPATGLRDLRPLER
jgi:hypothetical protein